jgi:hypothetical protein
MEWEQCLRILPPGGLVRLYITPGSGIYFKDSAPPTAQYFYEQTADKKETLQTTQLLQDLSQIVPGVLGGCFSGNKILPYHVPDWLSEAVNVKPTRNHEVELDINVDGLFTALFDKAMSLMKSSKFSFAREFWLKALSIKPQNATVLYNLACTETLLGNKRTALGYLKNAFDAGFSKVEHAATDSDLESLRSDPEFQALLASARPQVVIKTEVKEEPREEEMEVEPQPPLQPEVPTPCFTQQAPIESHPVPMTQDPVPEPQPVPVVEDFAAQLADIRAMGFKLDDDLLVSLLVAYEGDVSKVVSHLCVL